ncbi:hypothetical protein HaLaN_03471 [Haematococcus lacustris]|uniref:Uncharacterized protein n=1 Tax=Haematococcus lacustris TaxID=44745 RepID=A0A699YKL1_HAELA|nr:hypothetical protein HaLaN_03471 [Haematococcus lacustris]
MPQLSAPDALLQGSSQAAALLLAQLQQGGSQTQQPGPGAGQGPRGAESLGRGWERVRGGSSRGGGVGGSAMSAAECPEPRGSGGGAAGGGQAAGGGAGGQPLLQRCCRAAARVAACWSVEWQAVAGFGGREGGLLRGVYSMSCCAACCATWAAQTCRQHCPTPNWL